MSCFTFLTAFSFCAFDAAEPPAVSGYSPAVERFDCAAPRANGYDNDFQPQRPPLVTVNVSSRGTPECDIAKRTIEFWPALRDTSANEWS